MHTKPTVSQKFRRGFGGLAALVLVAGCSSSGDVSPVVAIARSIVPAIGQVPGLAPPPETVPAGFAATDIAADTSDYRLMFLPIIGEAAPGRLIADNGNAQTFLSQSGYSAAYVDDILVATRGLGEDLLAADVRGLRAAIARGSGTIRRTHDMLGDLDQIVSETFDCEVVTAGREIVDLGTRQVEATKITETCRGSRTGFANTYWLEGGVIVSSLQFISASTNYLRIARL